MRISLNIETVFYILAGLLYLFYSYSSAKKKRAKALEKRKGTELARTSEETWERKVSRGGREERRTEWEDEEKNKEPKTGFEAILEELEKKMSQEIAPEPKHLPKKEVFTSHSGTSGTHERKKTREPLVHIEKGPQTPREVYSIEYEPRKKIEMKNIPEGSSVKTEKELPLRKWLIKKNNLKKAVVLSTLLNRYEDV